MGARLTGYLGLTAILALAACGGGGGGGTPQQLYVPNSELFNATSPDATLSVIGLNRSSEIPFTQTTTLAAPSTLTGGKLAGTVNYTYAAGATNTVDLNSGGSVTLNDEGNVYAFRFGNADIFGVAGIAATNVPTGGTAIYNGFADVIVNDGTGPQTLLTQSTTTATFDAGRVDVRLSNAGSDWIKIDGATISGNTYSDGNMSVSGTFATAPVTSGSLQHEGMFFKDNAKEVGGWLIHDRTGAGINFIAQGTYGGNDGS